MNSEEFANWTWDLVEEGKLTPKQAEDVREQRVRFDRDRQVIEQEFRGAVVGYVAGERLVGSTTPQVLDEAGRLFGRSRQVYFEPIGSALVETSEIESAGGHLAIDELRLETHELTRQLSVDWRYYALRRVLQLFGAVAAILVVLRVTGVNHLSGFAESILVFGVPPLIALVALGVRSLLYRWRVRREAKREKIGSGP